MALRIFPKNKEFFKHWLIIKNQDLCTNGACSLKVKYQIFLASLKRMFNLQQIILFFMTINDVKLF